MTSTLRLLVLVAVLFPGQAQATAVEIDAGWHVRIDGRYYGVAAGTIDVGNDAIALGSLSATLSDCRRIGGEVQVVTTRQLSFADGAGIVYLHTEPAEFALTFAHDTVVLELVSATADIVCAGEQLPPGTPENIFLSDFE